MECVILTTYHAYHTYHAVFSMCKVNGFIYDINYFHCKLIHANHPMVRVVRMVRRALIFTAQLGNFYSPVRAQFLDNTIKTNPTPIMSGICMLKVKKTFYVVNRGSS